MKRFFGAIKNAFTQTVKDQYPEKVMAIHKMRIAGTSKEIVIEMINDDKDLSKADKKRLITYVNQTYDSD